MREAIVLRQALRVTNRIRSGQRSAQVQGWINEWGGIHDLPSKYKKTQARKKEANLRNAIDLYHLSEFFFPVKAASNMNASCVASSSSSSSSSSPSSAGAAASSSSPSSSGKVQAESTKNESERFDETLDTHVRYSIAGSSTNTSTYSNLDATFLDMKLAHMALYNKTREDEIAFGSGSGVSDPTYDSSSSSLSDGYLNTMWPSNRANRQSRAAAAASAAPSRLVSSIDDDVSSISSILPPIEDEEAVKLYIAETARRRAQKARSPSGGQAPGTDINDTRGSQVRDALYGTVGGRLPGLEVLLDRTRKERIARHEKKHRDFYVDKHIEERRAEQRKSKHTSMLEDDKTQPESTNLV